MTVCRAARAAQDHLSPALHLERRKARAGWIRGQTRVMEADSLGLSKRRSRCRPAAMTMDPVKPGQSVLVLSMSGVASKAGIRVVVQHHDRRCRCLR